MDRKDIKIIRAHTPLKNEEHEVNMKIKKENPILSRIYPQIDTDLARDNMENDIPFADRQDLY